MSSALLATEFVSNLTDETLVYLFNSCVEGITTNGRAKDGGFTTAKIIIEEMAVRRKIPDLELARFGNCEPVFYKLMTFAKSADRSAKGRMPKIGQNSDSIDSLLWSMGYGHEHKSGPESIAEMAQYVSGADGPKKAQDIARARTAQFAESTSRDDLLVRAAEEIRRQQKAVNIRNMLGRDQDDIVSILGWKDIPESVLDPATADGEYDIHSGPGAGTRS